MQDIVVWMWVFFGVCFVLPILAFLVDLIQIVIMSVLGYKWDDEERAWKKK